MTAYINKLKDVNSNQQLPVTHERAVRDDNGTTAETKFQNLEGAMDKAYVANSDNGMGRITLHKNMVSGVNTLTQSMMQATNTIYVIRYDFTLGENITVPANYILEFDGGSISGNKTLTGTNTGIKAGLVKIFNTNVTLAGTWSIEGWHVEWFGAKGDGITDDTAALQKCATIREGVILLGCNEYVVTNTIDASESESLWKGGFGWTAQFQSNDNLNTIIRYKGGNDITVFYLPKGVENISICGNHNYDDNPSNFIGTGAALGKGARWIANGHYINLDIFFFKNGLHLNSSFGCVFDGIKLTRNYIGLLSDPEVVEGVDSGYVTLITFNSFEIADNKYAGIAKVSDRVSTVRANFNNGYIEGNGYMHSPNIQIITNPQISNQALGYFTFINTCGENRGKFADIGDAGLNFINCNLWSSSLEVRYGTLTIINSKMRDCVVANTAADFCFINSEINTEHMELSHKRNLSFAKMNKSSVGNDSASTDEQFNLSTVPEINTSHLQPYRLPNGLIGMDYGSIIYKKPNFNWGNIPNGTSDNRPNLPNDGSVRGFIFFDDTIEKPLYHVLFKGYREYDGALPGIKRSGTTSERPVGGYMGWNLYVGFIYFDTDLGKPIYAKDINSSTGVVTWVDATGQTV